MERLLLLMTFILLLFLAHDIALIDERTQLLVAAQKKDAK